jgi:hypothetical protein
MNQGQIDRIRTFVPVFQEYLGSGARGSDLDERQRRHELYSRLLSPEALGRMTELEFGQVISSLWASQIWGNKAYLVDKLLRDNGLPSLVNNLRALLWGQEPMHTRYDAFRGAIKGLGPASITEMLALVHPAQCGIWNDKARKALGYLGFEETFPVLRKYQITGQEYGRFNALLGDIADELDHSGVPQPDLLGVDYFLYEVWNAGQRPAGPVSPAVAPTPDEDFDHDELVDKLVAVGQWLGFDAEKEKRVAAGAVVDVVWQAAIANLGVVTYVFEVQRRGAIDSLILNLQRAQNNASVQRLIVVANRADLDRVEQEIATLPESFRKAVGFMQAAAAARAAELVEELSLIIAELQLVQSEFAG